MILVVPGCASIRNVANFQTNLGQELQADAPYAQATTELGLELRPCATICFSTRLPEVHGEAHGYTDQHEATEDAAYDLEHADEPTAPRQGRRAGVL